MTNQEISAIVDEMRASLRASTNQQNPQDVVRMNVAEGGLLLLESALVNLNDIAAARQ